jgi:hypothetical protein
MTSKAFGLAQLGNAYADGALSNRNKIINGAMQVAQRGTSVSNSAGGYTTVDRFFQTGTLGGTFAWEKSSDAPTEFSSSFKSSAPTGFSSLSSAASARIGTAFEGQDLQQLLKGTSSATDLTLSFWVKATVAGTYIVELYDTDNTRNICQSYTISASNTWQKVVMTFTGDTSGALDNDNAASLVVHWFLAAGSDFTSGHRRPTRSWRHRHAFRASQLRAGVGVVSEVFLENFRPTRDLERPNNEWHFVLYELNTYCANESYAKYC